MCGRYALTASAEALGQAFGLDVRLNLPPRYNIAPGQIVPVIAGGALKQARWGWTAMGSPAAGSSAAPMLINARAETIRQKPSFRDSFRLGRCLFPANAFYEWQHDGRNRGQPYAVCRADSRFFAMAGLWRQNKKDKDGECVIITVDANAVLAGIHPRMPAILPQAHWRAWVQEDPDMVHRFLKTAPELLMTAYPVSRAVNKTANDRPDLLDLAEIEAARQMPLL